MNPRLRIFGLLMLFIATLAIASVTTAEFLDAMQSGQEEPLSEYSAEVKLDRLMRELDSDMFPQWNIVLATKRASKQPTEWFLVRMTAEEAGPFKDKLLMRAWRRFYIRSSIPEDSPMSKWPHWWPNQKLSGAKVAYIAGAQCCFLFLEDGDIYLCTWGNLGGEEIVAAE